MNNKLKLVVVEDELDTQEDIIRTLHGLGDVEVVSNADSVDTAFDAIIRTKPDGIFLDIKINGGTGFMVIDKLKLKGLPIPPIVILTSYGKEEDYLETTISDYRTSVAFLHKPINKNKKLLDAINSIWAEKQQKDEIVQRKNNSHFFTLTGGNDKRIYYDDILWITTEKSKGTIIVTDTEQIKVRHSLEEVLQILLSNSGSFLQVHRLFIVNYTKVGTFNRRANELHIIKNGHVQEIPVSDTFLPAVKQVILRAKDD